MHNWWIAALEHFGILTRDEAQNISDNIKLGIHRENYIEAYKDLGAILLESGHDGASLVKKLTQDVEDLKANFASLDKVHQSLVKSFDDHEAEMKDLKRKLATQKPIAKANKA